MDNAYFDNDNSNKVFFNNAVISVGIGNHPNGIMDNVSMNDGYWKFGVVNV